MIGLDTNVLLRLGDEREPAQRARAIALLHTQGRAGSYVNSIVLSEFAWTLGRRYKLTRDDVADRLAIVLAAPEFVVANPSEAARALERYRVGPADFADYFLAEMNRAAGCTNTATFDIAALKSGEPFSPVPTLA
jgi:predicted nucleic-acid-binding protein